MISIFGTKAKLLILYWDHYFVVMQNVQTLQFTQV